MAFLTDDSSFTHVIAIDFGTGASGYRIKLTQLWYCPEAVWGYSKAQD
jgi:hypothetical protein